MKRWSRSGLGGQAGNSWCIEKSPRPPGSMVGCFKGKYNVLTDVRSREAQTM
jgi:hypothetical protein